MVRLIFIYVCMTKRLLRAVLLVIILLSIGFFLSTHPSIIHSSHVDSVLKLATSTVSPHMLQEENIWLPQDFNVRDVNNGAPDITAQSAYFIDLESGEVLYEKDPFTKRHIASLTKIMTVIVTLNHRSLEDSMKVSSAAASVDPDKMYLTPGDTLTVKELLDGIFLVSANDAAEVLAQNTTGDRGQFIQMMNQEALDLGMQNTHFINPSGLEEDDSHGPPGTEIDQHSTAYDVSLMARYAITKWPFLTDISSQPEIDLPATLTHEAFYLQTGINLVATYPGVLGFKIGFTPQAGLCIVTYAKREGKEVLGVILNSTQRREDTRALLDYSFQKLGVK